MNSSNNNQRTTVAIAAATTVLVAITVAAYSGALPIVPSWIFLSAEHIARQRASRYEKRRKDTKLSSTTSKDDTKIVTAADEIKEIVRSIFANRSKNLANNTIRIYRIEQTPGGEYVLCLVQCCSDNETTKLKVDLVQFCRQIADSQHIYTSTLVFLYDVTGGREHIVTKLLQTEDTVACCNDHLPHWMKQWCTELHLSKENKEIVMQALCRVEASRFPAAKIIVFPIATDYVSTLLPALHYAFPDDKHVFLYTGCIQAVAIPKAVPLQPLVSIHIRPKPFHVAMAKLPYKVAAAVEAWMAAVDTLILMQDDFISNSFLPYVCRLEYLLIDEDPVKRRWAVRSLMQYCTGSDKLVDRAIETIEPPRSLDSRYAKQIDAVVFCHNRILIAHKTLPDTVPPLEHWSLKQKAGPGGCSCCGIGGDEEEDMERIMIEEKVESLMARSRSTQATNYVDGKLGFAFDPSRFGTTS